MTALRCILCGVILAGLVVFSGCSDDGKRLSEPEPVGEITIHRLVPARTVVGDTVIVEGSGFGGTQGASLLVFARSGGGSVETQVVSWSDTGIRALVPTQAVQGPVSITQPGEIESNEVDFFVASELVTYSVDLMGLFQAKGCLGCHGSSGGLNLSTAAAAIQSGDHGPAVIRRKGSESNLVRKLAESPPFGSRMPFGCESGGSCLTDLEIRIVADWIDQGARNN